MVTFNDLTTFSGEEGDDALGWYKSFVNATSVLGERGMLCNFSLYLEPDSPAQVWCDELPEEALSSWTALDRNFRRMWLHHGGNAEAKGNFRNHRLTDEAIFTPTSVDVISMNRVVADWAEKHLQLGAATKLDDAALIQATVPYLPAFIRAFLSYRSTPPTTFRLLCTKIKEISSPILGFEQLRRQEKSVDWQAKMERKQDDMSKVLKKAQMAMEGVLDSKANHEDVGETDEVDEADKMDEADKGDTSLFFIPREWEKTKVSEKKARMVEMVKDLIRTLRKYKPSEITIDAARMIDVGLLRFYRAIKAPGQFHSSTVAGQDGAKSTVWLGLFEINYQQAFNGLDDVTEAIETWKSLSNSGHMIKGDCIYKPSHTHFHSNYNNQPYDIPPTCTKYDGGLIYHRDGLKQPHIGISPFNTVLYFLMSVYLAEHFAMGDKLYEQAAIDSANWVRKWGYDEGTHLVKTFTREFWEDKEWEAPSLSPYVTGLFIEGLCVLASVTGEQRWRSLAVSICDAAMLYPDWHDDEGIFKYMSSAGPAAADNSNVFRGLLIRGLLVAYQRNPNDRRLRHTIRSYINLQFNALREGAHFRGSYGVNWRGPYAGPYVYGEIAALDVLMAAVIVNHC